MNLIDRYVSNFTGIKKDWLTELVTFLRKQSNVIIETYDFNLPTFHVGEHVIAFAAQKRYFSFHSNDNRILILIKYYLPKAVSYKDCVKIKYTVDNVVDILCDVLMEIISYHNSYKNNSIPYICDATKWTKLSNEKQQLILNSAYCNKCGVTDLLNYSLHNDRFGLILKGKCSCCNISIGILIEDELGKYDFDEEELIELDLSDEEFENYNMKEISLYDLNYTGLELDEIGFIEDNIEVTEKEFALNEINNDIICTK